jgi:hypothetical protein
MKNRLAHLILALNVHFGFVDRMVQPLRCIQRHPDLDRRDGL